MHSNIIPRKTITSSYQEAWQQVKNLEQGISPTAAKGDAIVPILD